jgi:hypothetical protein
MLQWCSQTGAACSSPFENVFAKRSRVRLSRSTTWDISGVSVLPRESQLERRTVPPVTGNVYSDDGFPIPPYLR